VTVKRTARIAAFVLAAGLASGCEKAMTDVLEETRSANGARGQAGGDRYLAMRGKKTAPGIAFLQAPPDTFAPFDVSVRTGFFDPQRMSTANGLRVCLELSSVDFDPFFDLCADYSAAGASWNVTAFHGPPAVFLAGSVTLSGPEIELRTETDGTTLRFHAREAGETDWSPVAAMPWTDPGVPLKPSVGATNLRKGTTLGFDDPSYESAPAPGPLDAAGQVASATQACLLRGLDAFLALDGAAPDFTSAAAALDAAADAVGEAQAGVDALPPGRTRSKTGALLRAVAKGLAKASQHVAGSRADRAIASLEKAARKAVAASLLLSPQPGVSPH
jgi:hypothetical protein